MSSSSKFSLPLLIVIFLGISRFTSSHRHHDHHNSSTSSSSSSSGPEEVELRRSLQGRVSRVASLTDEAGPWNGFKTLLGAQPGDVRPGLAGLKSYLLRFGYIGPADAPPAFTDEFDNVTQRAVTMYQQSFGLPVTGRLDVQTLTQMIIPRCGREDVINGTLLMLQNGLSPNATGTQHLGVAHFSTFPGNPKWRSKNLTYAIDTRALSFGVSLADTEIAIDKAFATWEAAIAITFTRVQSVANANIRVSFETLDHGDGGSFDGKLGVLAHAFAPTDGRLHFDKQESWTVNVNRAQGLQDIDLLSVAIHEIGHLLGLRHSAVSAAVMYPSISPLTAKQTLAADDIAGPQALYGANPNPTSPVGATPGGAGIQGAAAVASWRVARVVDVVAAVVLAGVCVLLAAT